MIARRATFALVLAFVVAGSSCATLPAGPGEPPMTVAYVKQHIGDLHGRTIRMRGEVNECMSLTCKICDDPAEEDVCLGLDLFADSQAASYLVEELYRFATITIDARIDASCEVRYDPDVFRSKSESDKAAATQHERQTFTVCTDRASSVMDARVIRVDARKAATQGRFDRYTGEALSEASTEQLGHVKAFLNQLPWHDEDDDTQLKLFVDPEPLETGIAEQYILCECLEDNCTGRWPTMTHHASTRTPANPYRCAYFTRVGEMWVISP